MLQRTRGDTPGQVVIEGMIAEVAEALGHTHQYTGGIVRAVSLLDEGIVLRVLHHILAVGGVEVGAIEE